MAFIPISSIIRKVEEHGIDLTRKEVEEAFNVMDDTGGLLDTMMELSPAFPSEYFYLDPTFYEEEGFWGMEIEEIEEETEQIVFDTNRIATFWVRDDSLLVHVSSDGKAEEGWYFIAK